MTHETTSLHLAAGGPPAGGDAAEATDLDAPRSPDRPANVADLERERDEYYDRLLRVTAEFDNYRKRVERERQTLGDATAAEIIADLLPVLDDLERALQAPAAGEEAASFRHGLELILKTSLDVLRRRGVTPIEAVGQPFDPRLHEAIAYEPSEAHRDGEIIGETRRGYMLRDRLLRPSMVRVAKA